MLPANGAPILFNELLTLVTECANMSGQSLTIIVYVYLNVTIKLRYNIDYYRDFLEYSNALD